MKICSQCSQQMDDNYKLKMDNSPLTNIVISKNRKKHKIMAYVCHSCGKIDFYINHNNK